MAIDTIENTTSVSLLIPDSLFTKTSSTIEAVLKVTDQKGFWKKVSTRSKAKVSQLNISSSYDAEATLGGVHIALPLDTTFVAGHYIAFDSDPIQIFPDALLVATPEVVNTFESYLLENTNIVATYDRIPLNDGNGLNASYFSISKNFDERPDSTKVDSTINFKWDEQSMQGGLRVHWSGWITPPVEGLYTLKIVTGERANIIMDEDIFATDAETQMLQNPVFLKKGGYYPIDIYYTGTNSDTVSITWSSDALPEHIIPQNQLFTDRPAQIVNFYPNPFEDALQIHLAKYDGTKPIGIELVSLTGAIQFSTVADPRESITIPTETITRGMYFLKVNLQGHVFVYKVIKK